MKKYRDELTAIILTVMLVTTGVAIFASSQTHAASPRDDSQLRGTFYQISVSGVMSNFTELYNLGSESEVVEHKIMAKGASSPIIRLIPGRLKWLAVEMRRELTSDQAFANWRKEVEIGKVDTARKDVTITAFDSSGAPLAVWTLSKAWPAKYVVNPSSTAPSGSNAAAQEVLVVVCESIVRGAAKAGTR